MEILIIVETRSFRYNNRRDKEGVRLAKHRFST